jgi:hypothetical protein
MWKHEDPEEDPRWLNVTIAIFGSVYVLTLLLNFWIAIEAALG